MRPLVWAWAIGALIGQVVWWLAGAAMVATGWGEMDVWRGVVYSIAPTLMGATMAGEWLLYRGVGR